MNVMAYAHRQVKAMKAHRAKLGLECKSYREMLSACLKVAHQRYKIAVQNLQTGFRNLYRFISAEGKLLAFITAGSKEKAMDKYLDNGGEVLTPEIRQVSFGYPKEECEVYA